ncbi:MAG: DUF4040 domain-containing protein [Acidobacteria bacterium]|nr:MAG: DUF4040 domain-containing protein [Acidobacteriota bacterium]RPJ75010.1 MAG: DUF4040 domain-containing protein [Acidobacteriota bacterium]
MFDLLIVAATLVCALQAIRSPRLLMSALWLASASALTALMMYRLGAPEVAVIELSVGAGLVTVLFVFAINIAGEEPSVELKALVPWPLAWAAALGAIALGAWMAIPGLRPEATLLETVPFARVVWENRALDVLLQVVLIIGGVLAVLGLLSTGSAHAQKENQ